MLGQSTLVLKPFDIGTAGINEKYPCRVKRNVLLPPHRLVSFLFSPMGRKTAQLMMKRPAPLSSDDEKTAVQCP